MHKKRMLGIVGQKLGHSFSPQYFAEKFRKENVEDSYSYELFPMENLSGFSDFLLSHPDLVGFNVTIPYKENIMDFLQEISPEAKTVGAVNTVKRISCGENTLWKGYNTDVVGFEQSLLPFLGKQNHQRALVLGTGGAAKAVAFVLQKLGIDFKFVSRNPANEKTISYDDLTEEIVKSHTLIVNTTPLGMFPKTEECPPIPYQYLTSKHLCYDLVYNPLETLFLKKAKRQGADIKNGLEMLHLQANAAWEIYLIEN